MKMRYTKIRTWIESHLGTTMALGAALGIVCPAVARIPSSVVIGLLGFLIYLSCFRIQNKKESTLSPLALTQFYVARYLLLPIAVFYGFSLVVPHHAVAMTLLVAMPAGLSAPAFSAMLGGGVAIAFTLVVLSNALAPFTVPFILASTAGTVVQVDSLSLLKTLLTVMLIPFCAFGVTRSIRSIQNGAAVHGRALIVLVVSLIIMIVVGARREFFLSHPEQLPNLLFWSTLSFVILFVAGWISYPARDIDSKISATVSSGCNNAALGVSLALLYFPPEVGLFLVVAEIPWILGPVAFRWYLGRLRRAS